MEDIENSESITSYDSMKNNPKLLLLLRGKYVKLQLIQNRAATGFVYAIDPEGHSIILQEPCGETYQSILIPGPAILSISVIESTPGIKLVKKHVTTDLGERKKKLLAWFKMNLLNVTEDNDNIVFRSVLILPPYDVTSIFSTNLIVTKQVRDIVEKMPEDFKLDGMALFIEATTPIVYDVMSQFGAHN